MSFEDFFRKELHNQMLQITGSDPIKSTRVTPNLIAEDNPMKPLLLLGSIVLVCGVGVSMYGNRARNDEAEIREVWQRWAKAFQAHDIEGIMSIYAPDVVAFDFVPPLQYVGKDAYRKDYIEFLAQFDGPIDVEFRDLKVSAGETVAYVYASNTSPEN